MQKSHTEFTLDVQIVLFPYPCDVRDIFLKIEPRFWSSWPQSSSRTVFNSISSLVSCRPLDIMVEWKSRMSGRKTGMHCTMMVPTISDEYHMLEWALRQKYHSSFTLPSSFHPVLTAATMATIIP